MAPKVSERTCIVCRRKEPLPIRQRGFCGRDDGALFRLTFRHGAVLVDTVQRGLGRGAYVHRSLECLTKLLQGGRLGKALRGGKEVIDAGQSRQAVQALMESVASSISAIDSTKRPANKAGRSEGGESKRSIGRVRL